MTDRPWMKLYVADYLADTRRLSFQEHGVYLLLIMEYWQHGALPQDDKSLAKIVGATQREWQRYKPAVAAFFDENWTHRRIDREIAEFEAATRRRSEAGKRGGRPKKKQSLSKASPGIKHCPSKPESEPDSEFTDLRSYPGQGSKTGRKGTS